jgi:hypothetical protein
MDTPMKDLMAEPDVWPALTEVLKGYFPGVPVDAAGAHLAEAPLSAVVGRLPGAGPDLDRDLRAVLAEHEARA